jgi:hypothetical protein
MDITVESRSFGYRGAVSGQLPERVVEAAARTVVELMPAVAARVPAAPATALGRLGLLGSATVETPLAPGLTGVPIRAPGGEVIPPRPPGAGGPAHLVLAAAHQPSRADRALSELSVVVQERLLGALELTVNGLAVGVPDGLTVPAELGSRTVTTVVVGGDGEASTARSIAEQARPDLVDLATRLAVAVAGRPAVRQALAVDGSAEAEIAARHGAAYLALAVAVTAMVIRAALGTSAAIGVGIAVAVRLLVDAQAPVGYAAALAARQREEYVMPATDVGTVTVVDHRLVLAGSEAPGAVDVSGNGLAVPVPGGVVIHTGVAGGPVDVRLSVLGSPPESVETTGWDEVVEVSWTATLGGAAIVAEAWRAGLTLRTPPWPGDLRTRVHTTGRDDSLDVGERERYLLLVWEAPAAPEIVHKRTDRVGGRLRGEPDVPAPPGPEADYRWIRRSTLGEAATVTAVVGSTSDEVLRAFGADPAEPASLLELASESEDPWVAVLDVGDGRVLAVEPNGWQASERPVLYGLSRRGRAASMYWNLGRSRLSFAESGQVLASFEPGWEPVPAEAADLVAGMDLEDHRGTSQKGLAAVERFTGIRLREEDLAAIDTADVAYRILPLLPELLPEERLPDGSRQFAGIGPLDADTDLLTGLSDQALRDLAWWAAERVASRTGLADLPAAAATLAAREFTPEADCLARTSGLPHRGEHHQAWLALHAATNPDPLAAAIHTLYAAQSTRGGAVDLFDEARRRIRQR